MRRYALNVLNRVLALANVRVETLTRDRAEMCRFNELARTGQFDQPAYGAFRRGLLLDSTQLFATIDRQKIEIEKFSAAILNGVDYSFDNSYFSSPDTEVLYAMIHVYRPRYMVEIGCGNSTRVARQAILDHRLDTKVVAIDPHPRVDVASYADVVHRSCVEERDAKEIAGWLGPNDILFIDSSHLISIGGDVPFIYFEILPKLRPGVLVHAHDIFLPYEYPKDWVVDRNWAFNEQFLLNAILTWSDAFSIVWPGYFLQKTDPGFAKHFPYCGGRRAQSFWLLKR